MTAALEVGMLRLPVLPAAKRSGSPAKMRPPRAAGGNQGRRWRGSGLTARGDLREAFAGLDTPAACAPSGMVNVSISLPPSPLANGSAKQAPIFSARR